MKVDLIIPSYKDRKGLYATLMSIGMTNDVNVIIVDDCSGEDYNEVIDTFSLFFPIKVFKTSKNGGPGIARQFGVDHSFNEYIVFIDCGDVFSSPFALPLMIQEMDLHPEMEFISFAHYSELEGRLDVVDPGHNRIHGKIYRRAFLSKYNIRFNIDCPRANEDIGFNMNCRLVAEQLQFENPDRLVVGSNNEPTVIWCTNKTSITRQNDCAFYYKEQNNGLAHGAGFAIENAKKYGVIDEICDHLKYDVFCALYFFHISTLNRRPEFEQESLEGCLYFYKTFFKNSGELDMELLTRYYYSNLRTLLADDWDPVADAINPLTIYDFISLLDDLSEKE